MAHWTGTLFEGRFRCRHVDKEDYLIHVCRYIHRNPIEGRKPLVTRLKDWPYSNYPEWIDIRSGRLVSREFIEQYFENPEEYRKFVEEDVEMKPKFKEEFRKYLFD